MINIKRMKILFLFLILVKVAILKSMSSGSISASGSSSSEDYSFSSRYSSSSSYTDEEKTNKELIKDIRDEKTNKELIKAIRDENQKKLADLIRGTEINKQDSKSGLCLLHMAVISGNPEMVSLLIKKGANSNALDRFKRTPLDVNARLKPRLCLCCGGGARHRKIEKVLKKAGGRNWKRKNKEDCVFPE